MDLSARKALAESLRGREVRRVPASGLELREVGGSLNLAGWASVTERAYDMGYYQETIKRGAFGKTLAETPDVQLLLNHEGLPLARTISGTLRLTEDDRGLHVDADLNPEDPDVQRLAPKVQRGDIDQMSFAFRVVRQAWDDDYENREIAEVNIDRGDVSVVNQGANPATSFTMRSLVEKLIEPTDEALAELRELLAPQDIESALATLQRLMPAPIEEVVSEAPVADLLDTYRARAFALRARAN